MFRVGEAVKWRCPLDAEYSYGTILKIKRRVAIVSGSGYYTGRVSEVHIRYIRKLERGGGGYGAGKKYSKYSVT